MNKPTIAEARELNGDGSQSLPSISQIGNWTETVLIYLSTGVKYGNGINFDNCVKLLSEYRRAAEWTVNV